MEAKRVCPFCRESVHPEAIKCRHCGEFLDGRPRTVAPNKDEEHLKLLMIGHYVLAAKSALMGSIPVIHLFLGLVFLLTGGGKSGPPAGVGVLFILIGLFAIAVGWTMAIAYFTAGRCLSRRSGYRKCRIAAGIGCLFVPFGTVMGILTFLALDRPGVRALFRD